VDAVPAASHPEDDGLGMGGGIGDDEVFPVVADGTGIEGIHHTFGEAARGKKGITGVFD